MQTLQVLEESWTRKPGHRGFVRFAQALRREGQGSRAAQILNEGLQRYPRDLSAHLLQAQIAGESGDAALQKSSLEAAVAADPRSPAALWSLSSLLVGHQYFQQARVWLERYVSLYPSHAQAQELLYSVLSSLAAESSRHPAASVAIPMEESPADLVEGTFTAQTIEFDASTPKADPFAPQLGLGAADAGGFSFNTLGKDSVSDDVFATLEMPSFHDQNSAVSQRSQLDDALNSDAQFSETASVEPVVSEDAVVPAAAQTAPFGTLTGFEIEEPKDAFGEVEARTQWIPKEETIQGVTGSDISSRLEDLFKEEPSATAPMLDVISLPPEGTPAQDALELAGFELDSRMDVELPTDAIEALDVQEEPASRGKVTGRDVEDRLDDLFPISGLPETTFTPPSSVATEPHSSNEVVRGEDVDARLEELFGSDDLMATSAMERPSFPPEDEFEATIQLPTVAPIAVDPEELLAAMGDPSSEGTITSSFDQAILEVEESAADTHFDPKSEDPETLEQAVALGRETTAESMPVFHEPGSTMDLPAMQEPDSWQPGSILASRGSDVDSQLDELFASSSFPREQHFPPMSSPASATAAAAIPDPAPVPVPPPAALSAATSYMPDLHSEHVATTGMSRAEVTGEDINDRLDALFGTDSAFPDSSSAGGFAGVPTVTLAEEYLRQGHQDQAEAVYRELVALEPSNETYRTRLAQIQAKKNS
jgi:tetratricopeptide (TPR) repeat protein